MVASLLSMVALPQKTSEVTDFFFFLISNSSVSATTCLPSPILIRVAVSNFPLPPAFPSHLHFQDLEK